MHIYFIILTVVNLLWLILCIDEKNRQPQRIIWSIATFVCFIFFMINALMAVDPPVTATTPTAIPEIQSSLFKVFVNKEDLKFPDKGKISITFDGSTATVRSNLLPEATKQTNEPVYFKIPTLLTKGWQPLELAGDKCPTCPSSNQALNAIKGE